MSDPTPPTLSDTDSDAHAAIIAADLAASQAAFDAANPEHPAARERAADVTPINRARKADPGSGEAPPRLGAPTDGTPWVALADGSRYEFRADGTGEIVTHPRALPHPGHFWEGGILVPLTRIPRFGAQTVLHWPVAGHALVVAMIAERLGYSPEVQLYALHHDDHEAITGDVTAPLARAMRREAAHPASYDTIADAAQRAILTRIGLDPEVADRCAAEVKRCDLLALEAEREMLGMFTEVNVWSVPDLAVADRQLAADVLQLVVTIAYTLEQRMALARAHAGKPGLSSATFQSANMSNLADAVTLTDHRLRRLIAEAAAPADAATADEAIEPTA